MQCPITYQDKFYKFQYPDKKYSIEIINPRIEIFRRKMYLEFENEFINYFKNLLFLKKKIQEHRLKKKLHQAFNRWIMLQISFDSCHEDPLIPSVLKHNYAHQLEVDLRNWSEKKEIDNEIKQSIKFFNFQEKCNYYTKKIQKYIQIKGIKSWQNYDFNVEKTDEFYIFKSDGIDPIHCGKSTYKRIKLLYISTQPYAKVIKSQFREKFRYLAYALLIRYETIAPDGVRQGAMTQPFFNILEKELHINFESFAGTVGASSNHYCSLFYDLEKYFGSVGNFFSMKPISGFYQVNPPLDEHITELSIYRVLELLETSDEDLSFFMLIPAWDVGEKTKKGDDKKLEKYGGLPGYDKLVESKFLTFNLDITGKKIRYVQYQGKNNIETVYNSPHVLILQNKSKVDPDHINSILSNYIF